MSNGLDLDRDLILVQTVCKGYQHITNIAASNKEFKLLQNSMKTIFNGSGSTWREVKSARESSRPWVKSAWVNLAWCTLKNN